MVLSISIHSLWFTVIHCFHINMDGSELWSDLHRAERILTPWSAGNTDNGFLFAIICVARSIRKLVCQVISTRLCRRKQIWESVRNLVCSIRVMHPSFSLIGKRKGTHVCHHMNVLQMKAEFPFFVKVTIPHLILVL